MDQDYADINQASPKYYWLCRNLSEPEFDTSGNLLDIPLISMPEPILDYDSLNASEVISIPVRAGKDSVDLIGLDKN